MLVSGRSVEIRTVLYALQRIGDVTLKIINAYKEHKLLNPIHTTCHSCTTLQQPTHITLLLRNESIMLTKVVENDNYSA